MSLTGLIRQVAHTLRRITIASRAPESEDAPDALRRGAHPARRHGILWAKLALHPRGRRFAQPALHPCSNTYKAQARCVGDAEIPRVVAPAARVFSAMSNGIALVLWRAGAYSGVQVCLGSNAWSAGSSVSRRQTQKRLMCGRKGRSEDR